MDTDCYCTSLRVAARRASAIYDRALEPVGVNVAQWGLLRRLPAPGEEAISIQELADRAELERSTAARNLRVLDKLGLVESSRSETDRRVSLFALTAAAMSTLAAGEPLWAHAQREIERILTPAAAGDLRAAALSI